MLVSNDLMSTIKKFANLSNMIHMNKTKIQCPYKKYFASSGNRTRAARVAGEHSTTEPTMLAHQSSVLPPPNWWESSVGGEGKKLLSQSVGFEPTLPEGNWFLVSRLNHSATTAGYQHSAQTVDRPATDSRQKAIVSSEVAERGYQPKLQ